MRAALGRQPRCTFDEALYAALFPQVARQISQRSFASLFDHWLERGYGDTASGRQRVPFVPRLAEGAPFRPDCAWLELNEADYLMAFTPSGCCPFWSCPRWTQRAGIASKFANTDRCRFEALLARPFGVNVFAPFAKLSPLGRKPPGPCLQALASCRVERGRAWPYREKAEGSLQFVSGAWTRRPRYRVNLLLVEPDYIARLFETFAPGTFDDGYTVALLPWQLCPVRLRSPLRFHRHRRGLDGSARSRQTRSPMSPSVPVHIMPVAGATGFGGTAEPGRLEQARLKPSFSRPCSAPERWAGPLRWPLSRRSGKVVQHGARDAGGGRGGCG